jgi:hypothetical protein
MTRGLLLALVVTAVAIASLSVTGALANGGIFDGKEPFAIAGVAVLSGLAFYVAVRRAGLSKGKLVAGLATAVLVFPLLALFGPLAFCIAFLPNASCI